MFKAWSYFILLFLWCTIRGVAQDYHFSQFDANPFYINPALTGERLSEYKGVQFNATYRDQMSRYTKYPGSYLSIAAGIDEPINSKFSLGQFFYNNKSAKGGFDTFGFMLSGAHKIIDQSADNKNQHNLSVGLQFGFFNRTLFPERLTWDSQYSTSSADGFDRSLPSGEIFARQSYYLFNANFGIYYRGISKNKKFTGFGGFAIYNITKPNQSFYGDGSYSALPLRFNLHGGALIVVDKKITLMPQMLFMDQARARELNISLLSFNKIEGSTYELIYGLGIRNKDALIFQAGVRWKTITVRASYDAVINYHKVFGNRGFEFSLVCTLKKKNQNQNNDNKESVVPPGAIIQP